ncbi:MAG: 4-(cytidine 5'-diphospho)-2-C-methyl-D-erythritol kinase [Ignavibacterium sp.]
MDKLEFKSPAKINFGLNIINKRADGYHNIETIFYPINLWDILTFKKSKDFSFNSNLKEIQNENNLIIKAIHLLEDFIKEKINVSIYLQKNIPIGAGLGGGSSNAATTLLAINELYNLNLEDEIIFELAIQLGSDVPFFLNPIPSFATSRGEEIYPIKFEIRKPILIINPGIHISTKWAYENIIPKFPLFHLSVLNKIQINNFNELKDKVVNDFEEIIFQFYPEIKKIKDDLYNLNAEFSLMSGSGSSVFGIFPNQKYANLGKQFFTKKYFTYLNE